MSFALRNIKISTIKGCKLELHPNNKGKNGLDGQYGATKVPLPLHCFKKFKTLGIK